MRLENCSDVLSHVELSFLPFAALFDIFRLSFPLHPVGDEAQPHRNIKPDRHAITSSNSVTLCFLRFGDFKLPIPFQSLWKIIKLICVIQVFNAAMYYFVWVAYDYSVPSWPSPP